MVLALANNCESIYFVDKARFLPGFFMFLEIEYNNHTGRIFMAIVV